MASDAKGHLYRTGLGHDIHRLVPRKQLVLGGVHIPADVGFEGSSPPAAISCRL
ncbi:MAG TPA: 2-C-methyl-D-erythritol 2,4-cyclodiphosphate synthase [Gaiellales bacterium]|nr:2-C-methyl-D-erythritol 2,4-cyclodiphosphate synthase [Gaiellales bacterium]